jgi:hypothetical protein
MKTTYFEGIWGVFRSMVVRHNFVTCGFQNVIGERCLCLLPTMLFCGGDEAVKVIM